MKLLSRPVGVIVACTVGNGVSITPMVYTVFGMFLIPMATEFAWPRAAVSFSLLVVAVAGALAYPVIGRLIDRHGARPVILAGNVLFAATVACASLIGPSRPELYGVYGLIGIAGAIPSSVMFTKVIAGWFDRGRGFAMGIAGGVGNGVGAALSPLLVGALLAHYGWRGSFLGIAAVIVLIGFPVLFVLLWDPPGSYKDTAAGSALAGGMTPLEARSTSTFWIILVAIAIGAGCMTAVFAHVVPLLLDHGYSEERATAVLATFATVTAVWQVGVGRLIDRIPRPWIAAPFYLAALAGLILFQAAESFSQLMLAAALMGLGLGTEYGVLPYFLSRYFGVRHYGAISGTIYAVIVLAQGLTPFLMDLSFDRTGSYRSSMVVIGAGLIASALLILRLQPFSAVAAAQIPQKS
ncbi:MAG TPA: MFS transporter [Steroidobacteraceae bacterium]|nr:MFS transporter [Steroidobacteraceae bacterium]